MNHTTLYEISVFVIQEKYSKVSEDEIQEYTGKHLRGWKGRFGLRTKEMKEKIKSQVKEKG